MIVNDAHLLCFTDNKRQLTNLAVILLAAIILVLSLSACGFQLRGATRLPASVKVVHIKDSHPGSTIYPHLAEALRDKGVLLSDAPDMAKPKDEEPKKVTSILHLTNESFERRLLSSGTSSQIKEYQLNYAITFGLDSANGKNLLPSQNIHIAREQRFDESQVLSKIAEQEALHLEMMQDAVRQMLRRIQTIKN